jgi:hypothetical protein
VEAPPGLRFTSPQGFHVLSRGFIPARSRENSQKSDLDAYALFDFAFSLTFNIVALWKPRRSIGGKAFDFALTPYPKNFRGAIGKVLFPAKQRL